MKLLLVNKFHWMKGGSETAFLGLKSLLQRHGHTVGCFSMADPKNLPCEYAQYFVRNIDYEKGGLIQKVAAASKVVYSLEARSKMAALLSHFTPDLAHFHIFQHQISPSVFGPLRKAGVPIVLSLHDLKPICPNYKMLVDGEICERCKGGRFYNCLIHRCSKGSTANSFVNMTEMYAHRLLGYYKNVDKYIAVSEFYRQKMIEFGFSPSQIVHVPNFVDCEAHPFSDVDRGYALYFGRLSDEKGIGTLLEASALCPEVPLVLAGGGPNHDYVVRRLAEKRLSHVRYVGFQTGQALRTLLAESSFTVLPSEWYENCPLSVLESFASGKPAIGSNIGGIPELISEGSDGLLFEPKDVEGLARQMHLLWESTERRHEMGRTARLKVETTYTPAAHYEGIVRVYRSIL